MSSSGAFTRCPARRGDREEGRRRHQDRPVVARGLLVVPCRVVMKDNGRRASRFALDAGKAAAHHARNDGRTRTMTHLRRRTLLATAGALALPALPAAAQTIQRPARAIVGFPAGG